MPEVVATPEHGGLEFRSDPLTRRSASLEYLRVIRSASHERPQNLCVGQHVAGSALDEVDDVRPRVRLRLAGVVEGRLLAHHPRHLGVVDGEEQRFAARHAQVDRAHRHPCSLAHGRNGESVDAVCFEDLAPCLEHAIERLLAPALERLADLPDL